MRASCKASYLIANSTTPFSVGENLILSAAVKMSEIVHGKKYGDDIRKNTLVHYPMTMLPKESLKLVMTNLSS